MNELLPEAICWQRVQVTSPELLESVAVVAARGLVFVGGGNRLQTLNLYLPATEENLKLVGKTAERLPQASAGSHGIKHQVHVHGGAWRDPHLSASSIEPQVALAFREPIDALLAGICSINYTLAKFPDHPDDPYDPWLNHYADPAREGKHPQQVADVMLGLVFLRSIGLEDHAYILSAHSCGSCIALQVVLQPPLFYGLPETYTPPCPAAIVSLNGLYDLPDLIHCQDAAHEHLSEEYRTMLQNVFGEDEDGWAVLSPTRFESEGLIVRAQQSLIPPLFFASGSGLDQLVSLNQIEKLEQSLREVKGVSFVRATRSVGYHAMPWETGTALWQSVQDAMALLPLEAKA